MFNMRIDIIRKELERRFKEVEELEGSDYNKLEEGMNKFLYYLHTDPLIRDFIIGLSRFDEDYLKSEDFNEIKTIAINSIQEIITEIDNVGFVNEEFAQLYKDRFGDLKNHFKISDSDDDNELISLIKYIDELRNIESSDINIVIPLSSIKTVLFDIFQFDIAKKSSCDFKKIRKLVNDIDLCIMRSEAYLKYKAEYEGASSLYILLDYYKVSPYTFLTNVNRGDFGKKKIWRISQDQFSEGLSHYLINNCKVLYHAVDKYLMTGKSKNVLIERLKTYCTWFKLEKFWKAGIREEDISKIIEEYIFSLGYYPIVNPRAGRSIYDILAESGENLRWDNSVLIELKQYIGDKNNCTESSIKKNIAQAQSYLSKAKVQSQDLADMVYLLVFYDGNTLLDIDDSLRVPNVEVEFIYVGKSTPSELKQPIALGRK